MKITPRKTVVRNAVITRLSIVAECPIDAVCVAIREKGHGSFCGYYKGSFKTAGGSRVVCQHDASKQGEVEHGTA